MEKYVHFIIRHRILVILTIFILTAFAIFNAKNIQIIIDPNKMMPQSHPYVATSNKVEEIFGSKHVVVVGIHPKTGDIYQPDVLKLVRDLTKDFMQAPGVIKENLLSLSAKRAKDILGFDEGLEVTDFMTTLPNDPQSLQELRSAVERNPVYHDTIVSADAKMTAILIEFKDEPAGFRTMMEKVNGVLSQHNHENIDISIGGLPNFLSRVEIFSERMGIFLPISFVILCLVLFEAFRTGQALILPLVTSLVAVIWGVGVMGALNIPMDVFNATTPILILAIATGHAVQLLKRYYEEYSKFNLSASFSARDANKQAIVNSLTRVAPVMITAGAVASLGFLSLMIFEISTVKTFGIFTALGIFATVFLEMTLIPALRSIMPSPKTQRLASEDRNRVWNRITHKIAQIVTSRQRATVLFGVALLVAFSCLGMTRIVEDNSVKKYFSADQDFQKDDITLNEKLGGTNTFYILIDGKHENALKNPQTLQAIDNLQQMLNQQDQVGKTISIVDFIKRMNQAMHNEDPAYFAIPDSEELVSQYLLLYSMSGDPGDFDSYVDYNYEQAKLTAFIKTDSTAFADQLIAKINDFVKVNFDPSVTVSIGGSAPQDSALNEAMVNGKLLNIAQISLVVFLISSIIFRSITAGVFVMIPLLVAVVVNFGLMGWSGILLNIPTSLTSAMAVGIGADYAIYLIYRLREELAVNSDENNAVAKVLDTAGEAILFVAVAIAAGYGVLLFSFGFYIHMWLATLIAVAMITSALAALLILPSLILMLRPQFIFGKKSTMERYATAAIGLLVLSFGAATYSVKSHAETLNTEKIVENNFFSTKVVGSTSSATFTLINKSGQERKRKVLGVTKLSDNGVDNMRMTRFLAPADVNGTTSLLIEHSNEDDNMWIYLPALKKVRRLVSNNKKDSFIGTDFSYADVIGYKTAEWNYNQLPDETLASHDCYVIEASPKNDQVKANTGYSKRKVWIRKDNFVSIKSEFWDANGDFLKTIEFEDIQEVDSERNRWQPMKLTASNQQTGHTTIIAFEDFKVSADIDNKYFTTRYMEVQ